MDIQFDFSSVREMGARYKGGDRIVLDEIKRGVDRSVSMVEQDAKRLVPTDTHFLQKSIGHEVVMRGQDVIGRAGSNVIYAPVVEFGRSAGAPMPPSGVLLGWMGRKGIDASLEYVVRRKIGAKGTRKQPYMKPALDKNRAAITREMTAVLKRIANRLAAGRG